MSISLLSGMSNAPTAGFLRRLGSRFCKLAVVSGFGAVVRVAFAGEEVVEMSESGAGPGDGRIIEGEIFRVRAGLELGFGFVFGLEWVRGAGEGCGGLLLRGGARRELDGSLGCAVVVWRAGRMGSGEEGGGDGEASGVEGWTCS